jgi:hypothetical protein
VETKDEVANSARASTHDALARLRGRSKVAGHWYAVLDREWAAELAMASGDRKAELEKEREAKTMKFSFGAVSPQRYEELLSLYRPTPDQIEAAKGQGSLGQPRWNGEFPVAFVHEVLVDPKLTKAEVHELMRGDGADPLLTPAEANEFFTTVISGTVVAPTLADPA